MKYFSDYLLENYIKVKYDKAVKYNRFLVFFFNILYINFSIQDLNKRLLKS